MTHIVCFFSQKGLTIMEVVIYVCLISTITIICHQFYQVNINTYKIERERSELFQDLKTAISMISKDIRLCGCDPLNSGNMGFVNESDDKDRFDTDSNSIHITADLVYPWDGKATEINERVKYFLYSSVNGLYKLGRCTGNSIRPQPVAERIISMIFSYYDLSGKIMSNPPTPLSAIGSVEIFLKSQSLHPNPITKKFDTYSLKNRVWIRNASF
ncbi:type cleavage/methylation domain-containing protein [Candidatus Magnetomorum sp. HK-1]|nr:type cleavage/methylation domain-containing protein [Candidatus Magnetomorum sp. HK-1]